MKSVNNFTVLILLCAMIVIVGSSSVSAQKSIDGKLDISLLMKEATARHDLDNEDAIILFDSERIRLSNDSRYTKYVHRIIWINTEIAVNRYGDVRVAFDQANCSLRVETIRTWRDDKWWETGPAGIVETMPEELIDAYDYANMRETMLLHEGIELPCILEIAYSIEDKTPFRRGWDGSWSFVRDEPVIKSWFGFELPSGWWPNIFEFPGSPAPIRKVDDSSGLDIYSWQRGPYSAKTFPTPEKISDNESYIIWSTWRDWGNLGAQIRANFDIAAVGDQYLIDQLDSILEGSFTSRAMARQIAKYVNDKVTYIDYPWKYWISDMRSAPEISSSTYGHTLDRAILAAALFSKAKINTLPVFLNPSFGDINGNVPGLSQLNRFGLWLSGDNLAAYYDPTTSEIKSGPFSFFSRSAWLAGNDSIPRIRIRGAEKNSLNNIRIDISYDEEAKKFIGKGFSSSTNYLNQFMQIAGMENQAFEYFEKLISSVFKNAKLTRCNPGEFNRLRSIFGFEFEIDSLPLDKENRIVLNVGESNNGILANLPDKAELYHNLRTSPIHFPCLMSQNIKLNINLEGLDLIHYPEDKNIENEAGHFAIQSIKTENKLTVIRSLSLKKINYTAEEWLPLRTLLLADRNDNNRLILLEED